MGIKGNPATVKFFFVLLTYILGYKILKKVLIKAGEQLSTGISIT